MIFKNRMFRCFILLSALGFSILETVTSQWEVDRRMTIDPAVSYTPFYNNHCLTGSGSTVHFVWMDNRDGNYEIYYKRSMDAGITWGNDTRLSNNILNSYNPSIAVEGQNVYVVWNDLRDGNDEIYFKRSTNLGINWDQDLRLTNNASYSHNPAITVIGTEILVFWGDGRESNGEIFYKRSVDKGVNWGNDLNLTNNIIEVGSGNPAVSFTGTTIHLVCNTNSFGNYEITYKRSTNYGISWSANQSLTSFQSERFNPSISSSGQFVHLTWFDKRNGNFQIFYKRSIDGGNSWGPDILLSSGFLESKNPQIVCSGDLVHAVWYDMREMNPEVYYKRSINTGTDWEPEHRLTINSNNSTSPYIFISGSNVHVVWTEDRDGNSEIYYKRNPTGNLVGLTQTNSEIPHEYSLSQNYPNPFNPMTKLKFQMPKSGIAVLKVFDVLGKEIQVLVNQQLLSGTYEVDFDGSNLPSGVYYYRLDALTPLSVTYTETRKMVLIK